MSEKRGARGRGLGSSRSLGPAGLLVALALSGCMTPAEGVRVGTAGDLAAARLQDPGADAANDEPPPISPLPPPLPGPTPPSDEASPGPAEESAPVPATTTEPTEAATGGSPAFPSRAARRQAVRNSPALVGLSSIAKNRAVNRILAGAPEEEEAEFPDIHDDPLARAGVPVDERDPFLLPWLMNLIFEDRWGLETDPVRARTRRIRKRATVDIRDPDPDTANFPNGAYTLPKGRMYIENSPIGFYGASKTSPRIYQWDFLIRYGLTDNLEFRIFSNGLTYEAARGKQPAVTGFSPLAFDFKANFWEENPKYHIPAVGLEVYLQTTFGSSAFSGGTQPSMNLLFDQSLPLEIGLEWNVGITGVQNASSQVVYEFSFQWSFQREVVEDFDIFVHGFYNAAALPRLLNVQESATSSLPTITVVGVGGIWTVNDRLAIFGSYNFGLTPGSPGTIVLSGFAVAF